MINLNNLCRYVKGLEFNTKSTEHALDHIKFYSNLREKYATLFLNFYYSNNYFIVRVKNRSITSFIHSGYIIIRTYLGNIEIYNKNGSLILSTDSTIFEKDNYFNKSLLHDLPEYDIVFKGKDFLLDLDNRELILYYDNYLEVPESSFIK